MLGIRNTEINQGIDHSLRFIQNGHYQQHGEIIVEKISGGADGLMEVLALQVAVDSTLDILNRHRSEISPDIDERGRLAASCALQVVLAGTECDLFLKAYEAGPLDSLLTAVDVSYLTNADYLISLVNPVFYDSARLVGGAHRKLHSTSLSAIEPRAATITRSTGLLAVSKIAGEMYNEAWTVLGKPYIQEDFLIVKDSELPEVSLSDTARQTVMEHSLPGRGCPAAFLNAPNGQGTLLTSSWKHLVDYYLHPGATTQGAEAY